MITADIFATCHFPEISHGHGPGMWVYVYGCTEHPRLQIKDVGTRKARKCTRIYLVDGKEHRDQEAAIAALNVPVVVTAEEDRLLEGVPADWTDCPPGARGARVEELHGLRCKGLVEWRLGKYRRVPSK